MSLVELRYCPVCKCNLQQGIPDLDQSWCLARHGEHYYCRKGHHVHITNYQTRTRREQLRLLGIRAVE